MIVESLIFIYRYIFTFIIIIIIIITIIIIIAILSIDSLSFSSYLTLFDFFRPLLTSFIPSSISLLELGLLETDSIYEATHRGDVFIFLLRNLLRIIIAITRLNYFKVYFQISSYSCFSFHSFHSFHAFFMFFYSFFPFSYSRPNSCPMK